MTTFRVSLEELRAFGSGMNDTASTLFGVTHSGGLASPDSGWPGLDDAVGGFSSHWGSTLGVLARDLAELSQKVTGAVDAYDTVENEIVKASGG